MLYMSLRIYIHEINTLIVAEILTCGGDEPRTIGLIE